jgi:Mn-containing catalase
MLEQFGGPQGELAAALRYFTQAIAEDDPGRRDMLFDIATEELSHLEIIGSIVSMLNKGAKGPLAEATQSEAELYRSVTQGADSHTQAILYGGGAALTNSSGVPLDRGVYRHDRRTDGGSAVQYRSRSARQDRVRAAHQRHR